MKCYDSIKNVDSSPISLLWKISNKQEIEIQKMLERQEDQ